MHLVFNWTTAALVGVPGVLFLVAFWLWLHQPQPIIEYIYDDEAGDPVPYSDDLIQDGIAEMPHYVDRRTSAAAMDEAARRAGNNDDSQAITAMYFVVLHEWGF